MKLQPYSSLYSFFCVCILLRTRRVFVLLEKKRETCMFMFMFIIATLMKSLSFRKFHIIDAFPTCLTVEPETRPCMYKEERVSLHGRTVSIVWHSTNKKNVIHHACVITCVKLFFQAVTLEKEPSSCLSLPLLHHFLPALPSSGHGSLLALRAVASLSLYEEASRMARVACPQKDAHCLQISSASDLCPIKTNPHEKNSAHCCWQGTNPEHCKLIYLGTETSNK